MNKKSLLVSGSILFTSLAFSQITITSSDIGNENDTAMVSITEQFSSVDVNATGPNHSWDFSYLDPL